MSSQILSKLGFAMRKEATLAPEDRCRRWLAATPWGKTAGAATVAAAVSGLVVLACGVSQPHQDAGRDTVMVSWAHAVALIRDCRVEVIGQPHEGPITLTLVGGTRVRTIEPMKDAAFDEARALGGRCGQISFAQE